MFPKTPCPSPVASVAQPYQQAGGGLSHPRGTSGVDRPLTDCMAEQATVGSQRVMVPGVTPCLDPREKGAVRGKRGGSRCIVSLNALGIGAASSLCGFMQRE